MEGCSKKDKNHIDTLKHAENYIYSIRSNIDNTFKAMLLPVNSRQFEGFLCNHSILLSKSIV